MGIKARERMRGKEGVELNIFREIINISACSYVELGEPVSRPL